MSPLLPFMEKGTGVEDTSGIKPDFNIELVLIHAAGHGRLQCNPQFNPQLFQFNI